MIDLYDYARSVCSQFGQDGIITLLAELIKPKKYFVEFGSNGNDFGGGNTPILRRYGWEGLVMDAFDNPDKKYDLKLENVTYKNINDLLTKYKVPKDFGFLSIDIDSQDYWVWDALEWNPDIVLIEANHTLGHDVKWTVPKNENFVWDIGDYYGASRRALLELGQRKGYSCVSICVSDMIFLKNEHLHHGFKNINDLDALDVAKTYLWIPEWKKEKLQSMDWTKL